jgi:REP element-mobilizing transposase RayT
MKQVQHERKEGGHSCPLQETKSGLENPPSPSPFLDPNAPIDIHEHRLPHWQQDGVVYFVTWRLADSLPQAKLAQLQQDKDIWLRSHPAPWTEETEEAYHSQFSEQIDEWLDAGEGVCVLRDPKLADVVAAALWHFDGMRYDLEAFVVMPNHVHLMFRVRGGYRLEQVIKSWKGFTANKINERIGQRGCLWQEDYWDRIVQNPRHWRKCFEYIRDNPNRAKLKAREYVLFLKEGMEGGLSSPPSRVFAD